MREILALIQAHLSGSPDPAAVERICSTSSSLPACQAILADASSSPNVRYLASQIILSLINRFSERWQSSECTDLCTWCLDLISSDPVSLLASTFAIRGFAQMFGALILHRYHLDEPIGNFFQSLALLFSGSVAQHTAGLHLLAGTLEAYEIAPDAKLQSASFFETEVPNCVRQAAASLNALLSLQLKSGEAAELAIASAAIQVLTRALNLNIRTYCEGARADDIEIFSVTIPRDSSHIFSDPLFIQLILGVLVKYNTANIVKDSLDLFFQIVSIKQSDLCMRTACSMANEPRNGIAILYNGYLTVLTKVLEMGFDETFHRICLISYKLSLGMRGHYANRVAQFAQFCQIFKEFTLRLVRPDFFLESPHTVFYAIKFWTCFSGYTRSIENREFRTFFAETVTELSHAYYQLICEVFVNHYSEAMTNFTVDQTGLLFELEEFTKMATISFDSVCIPLLAEFSSHRNTYFRSHTQESEICLSVLVEIFTGILISKPSMVSGCEHLSGFEIKIFRRFLKLLERTGTEIQEYMERGQFMLESRLLCFCRNLKATNFGSQSHTNLSWFAQLGRSFVDTFLWLFARVMLSLRHKHGNRGLFLEGISALSHYFLVDGLSMEAQHKIPLPALLECEQILPSGDRECRYSFLTLVFRHIFSLNTGVEISALLSRMSDRFQAEMQTFQLASFTDLLGDLATLATVLQSAKTYAPFFQWFVPNRMQAIESCLTVISSSPVLMTPVMFFWLHFIDGKGARIRIGEFSGDGILIFRSTAAIIRSFLDILEAHPNLEWLDFADQFQLTAQLLATLFEAKWITFDVFHIYSDNSPGDLLVYFFSVLFRLEFTTIQPYPLILTALSNLVRVLMETHFAILHRHGLLDHALEIIRAVMFAPTVNLFSDGLKALNFFLKAIIGVELTLSRRTTRPLLFKLFEVVLNGAELRVRELALSFRGLLQLDFDSLQTLTDSLAKAVPDVLLDEMTELFLKFDREIVFATAEGRQLTAFVEILVDFNQFAAKIPSTIYLSSH
jgi:hypothetical protein